MLLRGYTVNFFYTNIKFFFLSNAMRQKIILKRIFLEGGGRSQTQNILYSNKTYKK